tara:strand:- start:1 stop:249 length:249 start_codon:yes stop_codon:yes gene_type:complete
MIATAILKINPNAKVIIRGSDIDTCEIEWLEDTTPISKEDIKAMIPTVEAEIEQEKTDASTGKQKLKDLGLNDAEIKALIGV